MQSTAQIIGNSQAQEGLATTLEHAMTTDFPDTDGREDQLQIEDQMEQLPTEGAKTELGFQNKDQIQNESRTGTEPISVQISLDEILRSSQNLEQAEPLKNSQQKHLKSITSGRRHQASKAQNQSSGKKGWEKKIDLISLSKHEEIIHGEWLNRFKPGIEKDFIQRYV